MTVKVGVFPVGKSGKRFAAYTLWYNPEWEGCCEHVVEVPQRRMAKTEAIEEHKRYCVGKK